MAGLRGQWLLTVVLSLVSTASAVPEILHGTAEHGDVVRINRHVIVGSVCGGHGVALHVTDGRRGARGGNSASRFLYSKLMLEHELGSGRWRCRGSLGMLLGRRRRCNGLIRTADLAAIIWVVAGGRSGSRRLERLLLQLLIALGAVVYYFGDGGLDPVPMVFLRHGSGSLVDASMCLLVGAMVLSRNLVLHPRLRDYLLIAQHQLVVGRRSTNPNAAATITAFAAATTSLDQGVVPHCGAESVLILSKRFSSSASSFL